jgi:hypothetical protein
MNFADLFKAMFVIGNCQGALNRILSGARFFFMNFYIFFEISKRYKNE